MKTPALDLWRSELVSGVRTITTFDPLWRAACDERTALECDAVGLVGVAAAHQRQARRIITAARKGVLA